jgi:hypothetical protein
VRALYTLFFVSTACAAAAPAPPAPGAPPAVLPIPLVAGVAGASPGPAASPQPKCGPTPTQIGRIQDVQLNEVSGVVESHRNPEVLFVHNDSGDSPRFFAINRSGEVLAELKLETVPILIDAEDIATGPAPNGGWFLYLGDTGNNFASFGQGIPRRKAVLYRLAEPEISPDARRSKVPLRDAFPIVFTFPNGARDVEAFVVDPVSGDLFVITKQLDGHSQLLTATATMLAAGGGQLRLLGELRFGQPPLTGSTMPTSASISRDGSAILVRTYTSVFLFRRAPGESVPSALARAPESLPAPLEQQGEAIGFVDGDTAFVTISEGLKPAVNCTRIAP